MLLFKIPQIILYVYINKHIEKSQQFIGKYIFERRQNKISSQDFKIVEL